jgi:hypothetical protein
MPSGAVLHPDVAFFRVRSSGANMNALTSERTAHSARAVPVTLQLRNCFVRGAATFLQDEQSFPLALEWDNGILATSQRLLSIVGSPDSPPQGARLQVELRHVTALMRRGLIEVNASGDAPYALPVEVTASDSILLVDGASPLVMQSGDDDLEQLRKRLNWKGDRLFYEGVATFWRVAGPENVEDYSWRLWQTFWGDRDQHPHYDDAAWQTILLGQEDRVEYQRLTPGDFKLRPGDNPARHAGSDGQDAGCQLELLPSAAREASRSESS